MKPPPTTAADFDDVVMPRLAQQVATLPQTSAAMFMLRDEGFGTLFEQVVASLISARTLEHATLAASRALLTQARTPAALAALSVDEIDALIRPATFHEAKARDLHAIALRVVDEFGGELPCAYETLLSFRGVGPKIANLAIAVACAEPHGVPVDIHVHRIANRWGTVATRTPEATRAALEKVLPRKWWAEINRLLVPFGKHVCTGARPRCSTCALRDACARVGVDASR